MPTARACRTSRKCSSSRPAVEVSAPKDERLGGGSWAACPSPHSAVCSSQVDPLGTSFCSLLPPPLLLCKCFPMHGACWALGSPWLPGRFSALHRPAVLRTPSVSSLLRTGFSVLPSHPGALLCSSSRSRIFCLYPCPPLIPFLFCLLRLVPFSTLCFFFSVRLPAILAAPFLRRPCGPCAVREGGLQVCPTSSRSLPPSSLLSHASPPPRPRDSAQQTGGVRLPGRKPVMKALTAHLLPLPPTA